MIEHKHAWSDVAIHIYNVIKYNIEVRTCKLIDNETTTAATTTTNNNKIIISVYVS